MKLRITLNPRSENAPNLLGFTVIVLAMVAFVDNSPPLLAEEAETDFERLAEQYHRQREKFHEAYFKAKTDEERDRADRELNPQNVLLDNFFEMEKSHRKSRVGLSAVRHILAETKQRLASDPSVVKIKARRQALEILREHYWTNPDLDFVINILDSASKLSEEQGLLKSAEHHRDRQIRAVALWKRAMGKQSEATLVEIDGRVELLSSDWEKHREEIERWTKVRKYYSDVDPETSRREALRLLKRIGDEYPDVVPPPIVGRSPVLLPEERNPLDPRTKKPRSSLGELVRPIQFQLRRLSVGSEAPDIAGPDALGKERSLRSERGKVVVLMFSFKGCGPCEAMYPANRELINKHADRPFAFLGVMADETIETVNESIKQGVITWPVWWDGGLDGPICTRWNVEGWPDTYVIDPKGVIRYRELRGDALALAVEKLLAEAEKNQ